MAARNRDIWLIVIAVGKLLKATALIALGVLALRLRDSGSEEIHRWIAHAGLSPSNRFVHIVMAQIAGLDRHKLAEIGVGTFVYASFFLTEGIGLLLRKRWAEYFTIIITGSFVPFEIYEVLRHASAGRVLAVVLNVAAVAYLIWHLRITASRSEPA